MEMWRATLELKDCSLEDPEILPTIPSAEMTPPYSHFFRHSYLNIACIICQI